MAGRQASRELKLCTQGLKTLKRGRGPSVLAWTEDWVALEETIFLTLR